MNTYKRQDRRHCNVSRYVFNVLELTYYETHNIVENPKCLVKRE